MRRLYVMLFLSLALAALPLQAADDRYEIQLQSGRFTPAEGVSAEVVERLADRATELKAQGRSKVHVLVQLYEVPEEEEKAALERDGLELGTYLPRHAWIAAVPLDRLQEVAVRRDVRHMSLWDAERKVQPRLKAGDVSPWARDATQPDRI